MVVLTKQKSELMSELDDLTKQKSELEGNLEATIRRIELEGEDLTRKQNELEERIREIKPELIPGLLEDEIKEVRGVLFPSDSTLPSSRVGQDGALQLQADEFSKSIESTESELKEVEAELKKLLDTHADGEELIAKSVRN